MPNPISQSPLLPIQKALYQVLDEGLTVPVYDYVPEGVAAPYVAIGECTERPDNTHGGYGSNTVHAFHVVVKKEGFSSALLIVDEISEAIDHQLDAVKAKLLLEGHTLVSLRREMTQTLRDPDPAIRHALVRYRIVSEQVMEGV